ncbi:hypothetical protein BP6252_09068 [Coleophoma cylindrospora]|uniref:RNA helicase n=1 Tax=Coleophoma cylindrospora TaxID=1849047 RepID=A0A3D8R0V7_9HELO|nr:hypothetical protein BP6252_09068 [Coleophoma cylindrospora]
MAAWETKGMAEALPDANPPAGDKPQSTSGEMSHAPAALALTADGKTPQEVGWVAPTAYNYLLYNASGKDSASHSAATATNDDPDREINTEATGYQLPVTESYQGVAQGEWHSNAKVYEWNDEYGDIGPKFDQLEKQLFGDVNRVRTGINFANISEIEVIQEGTVRIDPVRLFDDAGLHPAMLENVKLAGYTQCTPVQAYTLPAILKGYDIVACAQTGSGKTAAYLIPTLSKLMGKAKKLAAFRPNPATFEAGVSAAVRAEPLILVVAPSRELATQIFDEARRFCYRTMLRPCVIYGGGPTIDQIRQLEKGCDVLIATPGRLCDFMDRTHLLTLKRLKYIVIDEADELLTSDWEQEMNKIMSGGDQEEGNITYLLYSATFPKTARDIAKNHLAHEHVRIRVGRAGSSHVNIKQDIVFVESSLKRQALLDLLMSKPPARTIVFVNSKRAADEVDDFLFNKGLPCTSIHADRTQREREDAIRAFRSGTSPILVATGVSARGLDIHNVMHVINYDLPSTQFGGIEEYTHRIGRTGRIGNLGLATSFYNDHDEDLGATLVKTLLETKQVIPDFLHQYLPEGFTAEGEGDAAQLKFETDSDFGDGTEETAAEDGGDPGQAASGEAWGAAEEPAGATSDWGVTKEPATDTSGWGTTGDSGAW